LKKVFAIAALWFVTSAVCGAEARWCSITGPAGSDLVYPEIARRATVFGVVKSRVIFLPTGEVRSVERIGGSQLLFSSVKQQILKWRVKTDAIGDAPCQAAVVVVFDLDDYAQWRNPNEEILEAPSVLKIVIEGESFPVEVIVTTNDPTVRHRGKSSLAQ
jgi:hypothetical protein